MKKQSRTHLVASKVDLKTLNEARNQAEREGITLSTFIARSIRMKLSA